MQLARTPLAAFGVVLTTACALLFLLALGAESYGLVENPYVGILIYGALPVGFAFGLYICQRHVGRDSETGRVDFGAAYDRDFRNS